MWFHLEVSAISKPRLSSGLRALQLTGLRKLLLAIGRRTTCQWARIFGGRLSNKSARLPGRNGAKGRTHGLPRFRLLGVLLFRGQRPSLIGHSRAVDGFLLMKLMRVLRSAPRASTIGRWTAYHATAKN